MTTLTKNPLRTSRPMLGHEAPTTLPVDHPGQPFGYLFAAWNPGTHEEVAEEAGHYDPDAQMWRTPDGVITAGVYTKTTTSGCPGDCVTDDACA